MWVVQLPHPPRSWGAPRVSLRGHHLGRTRPPWRPDLAPPRARCCCVRPDPSARGPPHLGRGQDRSPWRGRSSPTMASARAVEIYTERYILTPILERTFRSSALEQNIRASKCSRTIELIELWSPQPQAVATSTRYAYLPRPHLGREARPRAGGTRDEARPSPHLGQRSVP